MVRIPLCLPKFVVVMGVAAFLNACNRPEEEPGEDDASAGTSSQAESWQDASSEVKAKLAQWEKALVALKEDPEAYRIKAAEFGEDVEIPPSQSMQFAMKHFENEESRVAHFMKVMNRTLRADPEEALRVFSLIKEDPGVNAIFYAVAGAIGESNPELGITWLKEFPDNKQRGLAASQLGAGLVKFAATHPPEEVESAITQLLASDLLEEKQENVIVKRVRFTIAENAK